KAFSEFWVQRHTLSIPQSAFADSSLCTREVRWPDGHTVFAGLHRTSLLCGAGPGLQSSPYRVMVYHTRSTGAEQCIKPSASFGSSVMLVHRYVTGGDIYGACGAVSAAEPGGRRRGEREHRKPASAAAGLLPQPSPDGGCGIHRRRLFRAEFPPPRL